MYMLNLRYGKLSQIKKPGLLKETKFASGSAILTRTKIKNVTLQTYGKK